MNQKATYEITITEKLEQLTVPDMVDAIWSRIETQLDIDLPSDEGPSSTPSNPVMGGGKWIAPVLIIAVSAFFATLLFTNKKNPDPGRQDVNESPGIIVPDNTNTSNSTAPPNTIIFPGVKRQRDSFANLASLSDSTIGNAGIQLPAPDSTQVTIIDNNPVFNAPLVNNPPDSNKKKGRGVKGITDDDYRVVPARKDSIK